MKPKVVTVGLGYIGLPTSALIASHGINVLGVDVNKNVVNRINEGKIHIVEKDLEKIVADSVKNGFLKASLEITKADVYLIVVPTPFKDNYEPDISFIESATERIIPVLKENESTSPVGTTEKIMNLIYKKRKDLINKIFIAYCPERVLPGNIMHELVQNDRVIGGVDEDSTNAAINFYKLFVEGNLYPTNAKTAEMCKLVENSSRDVQIAFANELSLICDKANINVWELIALANKHPRVNILNPGCGVGGHCIAVDPNFLLSEFPKESQMIGKARDINNHKSLWCINKILESQQDFIQNNGFKPITSILGLTFKPNIDDLRESPAFFIAKELYNKSNEKYFFVEPNLPKTDLFSLTELEEAVNNSDIIVILVSHDEFKNIHIGKEKIVIDFCNSISK